MSGKNKEGGAETERPIPGKQRRGLNGGWFSVGRFSQCLKQDKHATRSFVGAPAYLAAGLAYISDDEILKLASNAARDNKRSRIIPCYFWLAVSNDE